MFYLLITHITIFLFGSCLHILDACSKPKPGFIKVRPIVDQKDGGQLHMSAENAAGDCKLI